MVDYVVNLALCIVQLCNPF